MSVLNTAVSGMQANTNWLTTIAQNVANANTTGYKNVETEFSSLVDAAQNSQAQFDGVTTTTLALNSLQGQNAQTTTTTNMAVQGAGYFIVEDSNNNIFLTRNGSFVPDASGDLVNSAGYYLLGSPAGQTGVALNSLSGLVKVNVDNAADTSIPSTTASLVANLPSTASVVTGALPSANSGASQYTKETSLVAYDNLGNADTINFYFTKTASNTWEVDAYNASDAATGGGFPYSSGPLATQTLSFDPNSGALLSGSPMSLTVPNGQTLTVDLGETTQLASDFAVTSANINGSAPGTISGVNIAQDGTLSFEYATGSTAPAYQIPLAKVASPDNLTSVLGDAYQTNPQSGAPQVGIPGSGGLGTLNSSSLEGSTVDLATELTNMVQAQSSYEANSKVFQAGAKLLDVLNNIQS
jgi:flagellar hook protein FlgE